MKLTQRIIAPDTVWIVSRLILTLATMQSIDVFVIGGGPAGSAAALKLARAGRAVALAERSRYEQARIGETLPPVAQPTLAGLGLWDGRQRLADARSLGAAATL